MVLAQKPPRSASGFVHWAQTNLFATIPDTILTIFGLLLTAVIVVPLVRWGFVNAQWVGTDRSFCATVAQGGIQPDGWSGACWAFVSAKFQQFMVGSYPFAERWRVVLTAVLFVALLVPLMIPKVPYKALNAIVFFGVFPVVGFMLLIGAALPFGLVGLLALIVDFVIWLVGASLGLDRRSSRLSFSAASARSASHRLAGRVRRLLRRDRIDIHQRQLSMPSCRSTACPATSRTFVPAPRTSWAARSRRCGWTSPLGARGPRPDAVAAQFDADAS